MADEGAAGRTTITRRGARSSRREPQVKRDRVHKRDHFNRHEAIAGYLFIAPWIIGFLIFTAGSMIFSLYISFSDYNLATNVARPIGFENYAQLFEDPRVGVSLANTLFYAVLAVPLEIIVALALALLLNRMGRGAGIFRTLYYLPKMTPAVATAALFFLLLNGNSGAVNQFLRVFGIEGPQWLVDPAWVKPSIVLMTLWAVAGTMVIFLAALKNVPADLYEVAAIDGAGAIRRFFSITLPMISGAMFFNVIVLSIAAFQTFGQAYLLFWRDQSNSSGGPRCSMQFYQPPAILLNKKVLDEAGVTADQIDTSKPDVLLGAIKKMHKEEGGVPTRLGFDPDATGQSGLWILGMGGKLNDDKGAPTLDDESNLAGIELLKKIVDAQGGWAAVKSLRDSCDTFGDNNQFVADQVGAQVNAQWYPNVLSPYVDKLELEAVPFRGADGEPFSVASGTAFVIPVGAKNPAAACAWMLDLTSQDAWMAAGEARADTREKDGGINTGLFWLSRMLRMLRCGRSTRRECNRVLRRPGGCTGHFWVFTGGRITCALQQSPPSSSRRWRSPSAR